LRAFQPWSVPDKWEVVYFRRIIYMLLEANLIHQHSAADAKIRLFRTLFRGRDDAYPRRFESRTTGRTGYVPACGNEWFEEFARSRESNVWPASTGVFFNDG
jgi:hypothetical protein